jgi:hypothetical protein
MTRAHALTEREEIEMPVSSYISNAQAILQKSVGVDVRTSQAKIEDNTKTMEANHERQAALEAEVKRKGAEAKEKAEHGFFGTVAKFFGEDGGEAEAKKALELTTADLDKATSEGAVVKQDQKDATARFSDAIEEGGRIQQGVKKALELVREVRTGA